MSTSSKLSRENQSALRERQVRLQECGRSSARLGISGPTPARAPGQENINPRALDTDSVGQVQPPSDATNQRSRLPRSLRPFRRNNASDYQPESSVSPEAEGSPDQITTEDPGMEHRPRFRDKLRHLGGIVFHMSSERYAIRQRMSREPEGCTVAERRPTPYPPKPFGKYLRLAALKVKLALTATQVQHRPNSSHARHSIGQHFREPAMTSLEGSPVSDGYHTAQELETTRESSPLRAINEESSPAQGDGIRHGTPQDEEWPLPSIKTLQTQPFGTTAATARQASKGRRSQPDLSLDEFETLRRPASIPALPSPSTPVEGMPNLVIQAEETRAAGLRREKLEISASRRRRSSEPISPKTASTPWSSSAFVPPIPTRPSVGNVLPLVESSESETEEQRKDSAWLSSTKGSSVTAQSSRNQTLASLHKNPGASFSATPAIPSQVEAKPGPSRVRIQTPPRPERDTEEQQKVTKAAQELRAVNRFKQVRSRHAGSSIEARDALNLQNDPELAAAIDKGMHREKQAELQRINRHRRNPSLKQPEDIVLSEETKKKVVAYAEKELHKQRRRESKQEAKDEKKRAKLSKARKSSPPAASSTSPSKRGSEAERYARGSESLRRIISNDFRRLLPKRLSLSRPQLFRRRSHQQPTSISTAPDPSEVTPRKLSPSKLFRRSSRQESASASTAADLPDVPPREPSVGSQQSAGRQSRFAESMDEVQAEDVEGRRSSRMSRLSLWLRDSANALAEPGRSHGFSREQAQYPPLPNRIGTQNMPTAAAEALAHSR